MFFKLPEKQKINAIRPSKLKLWPFEISKCTTLLFVHEGGPLPYSVWIGRALVAREQSNQACQSSALHARGCPGKNRTEIQTVIATGL